MQRRCVRKHLKEGREGTCRFLGKPFLAEETVSAKALRLDCH